MLSCRFLPRTQMNVFDCMIWVVGLLLLIATVEAQSPQASRRVASQAEEIYVVRSVNESRIAPTEFCAPARTGIVDAVIVFTCRPGDYLLPNESKPSKKADVTASLVRSLDLARVIERSEAAVAGGVAPTPGIHLE